jgi:hypothetical protein
MGVVTDPTPEEIEALVERFRQGMMFIWSDNSLELVASAVQCLRSCIDGTDSFGWRVIDALARQENA